MGNVLRFWKRWTLGVETVTTFYLLTTSPGPLGSGHILRHPLLHDSKWVCLWQGSPNGVHISFQPLGQPGSAWGAQGIWGLVHLLQYFT